MALFFDRLFFAIFPEAQAAERIEGVSLDLRNQYGLTRKPLAKERYHVSLHHVGDYPELPDAVVAAAERAAAGLVFPEFQITFDQVTSFQGQQSNRPVVLTNSRDIPKLMLFQKTLEVTLKLTGLYQSDKSRQFKPHLTLLYDDLEVTRDIDTIAWTVREFVLVHSLVNQSRYRLLKRFPLQAARSQGNTD